MAILSTEQKWKVGTASTTAVIAIVAGSILAVKVSAAAGIVFIALGAVLLLASFGYLVYQSKLAKRACERIDREMGPHFQNLQGNVIHGETITQKLLEQTICHPSSQYARIFVPAINQILREEGLCFQFERPQPNRMPLSRQEQTIATSLQIAPWQRNHRTRPQPNLADQIKLAILPRLETDPGRRRAQFHVAFLFQRRKSTSVFVSTDGLLNSPAWADKNDQVLQIQRTIDGVLRQNNADPRYKLGNLSPLDEEDSDDDLEEGEPLRQSMKRENPGRFSLSELDSDDES